MLPGGYANLGTDLPLIDGYAATMNRIAELRRLKGWSQEVLAEKVGAHKMTIHRLEKGETKLTVEWMQKLAHVFECSAADLLDFAALAEAEDDVEPVALEGMGRMMAAMARKGIAGYRVIGRSVTKVGVKPGDMIAVDASPEAVSGVKTGDIVLVEVRAPNSARVLRQYVAPGLLVTNRDGNNLAMSTDDPSVQPTILGVVMLE